MSYEELTRERKSGFREILKRLGLREASGGSSGGLEVDSVTTTEGRRGVPVDERISGWRRVLSKGEIGVIESVAQHFGLGDRLVGEQWGNGSCG